MQRYYNNFTSLCSTLHFYTISRPNSLIFRQNFFEKSSNGKSWVKSDGYPEQFTYLLPSAELASKYMAISAYNGSFSLSRLKDFGVGVDYFNETLNFCMVEGLMYKGEDGRIYVSPKGFMHYGALFSLFYSQ